MTKSCTPGNGRVSNSKTLALMVLSVQVDVNYHIPVIMVTVAQTFFMTICTVK